MVLQQHTSADLSRGMRVRVRRQIIRVYVGLRQIIIEWVVSHCLWRCLKGTYIMALRDII